MSNFGQNQLYLVCGTSVTTGQYGLVYLAVLDHSQLRDEENPHKQRKRWERSCADRFGELSELSDVQE